MLREVLTRRLEEQFSTHTAVGHIGHTILVAEEEGIIRITIAVLTTVLDVSARVLLLSLLIEHVHECSILRLEVAYEAEFRLLRIDMGEGEGDLLSEGGSNSFDIDTFLLEVRECFLETRELAVVLEELLCADRSSSGHIAILGEVLHEVILYGLGRDFFGELLELLEDLLVFATIGHGTHDFARLEGD